MKKSELRQIIKEEIKRVLNKIGINNKYVIDAGDSYKIDTKEASKYLRQFESDEFESDETPQINVDRFIYSNEWKEFVENYLTDIENMSNDELEDEMRKMMSHYYYGDEYSITEPKTTPSQRINESLLRMQQLANIKPQEDQNSLSMALQDTNTYDLETTITNYLVDLYNNDGFDKATDKMVAIQRGLEQARDQFDAAQ